MEPAYAPGDLVVASPLRDPVVGTPVIFEHPGREGFWLLKRLVGLPEDELEIVEGVLTVNGSVLEEPWTDGTAPGPPVSLRVPADSVFVMSDARSRTLADSRTMGPVPVASLYRVRFTYWPPSRIGSSRIPGSGR